MEAKVIQRGGALEVEQITTMLDSPGYARLKKRIEAELERARGECETATAPEEVYRRQGRVAALRGVLGLPEQILSDMRKNDRSRG